LYSSAVDYAEEKGLLDMALIQSFLPHERIRAGNVIKLSPLE
jgi:hypothetical protein